MNIFDWLAGNFSIRDKALSLYRRGMIKAKRRNHQGALMDYNQSLALPGVPGDVAAMVLFNRALAYMAVGQRQHSVDDLDAVLASDNLLPDIRTMARNKLARIKSVSGKDAT